MKLSREEAQLEDDENYDGKMRSIRSLNINIQTHTAYSDVARKSS